MVAFLELSSEGRATLIVGSTTSWAGVTDWIKRINWDEHQHLLLSASWLWIAVWPAMPAPAAASTALATTSSSRGWAVCTLRLGTQVLSLKLLCHAFCHSNKKSNIFFDRKMKWFSFFHFSCWNILSIFSHFLGWCHQLMWKMMWGFPFFSFFPVFFPLSFPSFLLR